MMRMYPELRIHGLLSANPEIEFELSDLEKELKLSPVIIKPALDWLVEQKLIQIITAYPGKQYYCSKW